MDTKIRITKSASNEMVEAVTTDEELKTRLEQVEPNRGTRRNKLSILGQFLRYNAANGRSVDAAFGPEFKANRTSFLQTKNIASKANIESALNVWSGLYAEIQAERANQTTATKKFATLAGALKFCLEAAQKVISGLTFYDLVKKAGINSLRLRDYVPPRNRIPGENSIGKMQQLEEYLINDLKICIAPGTLTSFVRSRYVRKGKPEQSSYGKYLSDRNALHKKDPIRLGKSNFPESLGEEYVAYTNFKSTEKISKLGLDRDDRWVLRNPSSYSGTKWHLQYCTEPEPDKIPGHDTLPVRRWAPRGKMQFGQVLTYFGVLDKLGYDRDKFSLVYLCDPELVEKVLDFLLKRNSKLGSTEQIMITLITSLLRKDYGFVWQQPAFGEKLLNPSKKLSKAAWHSWCKNSLKRISDKLDQLKRDNEFIGQTRPTLKNLKEYTSEIDPSDGKRNPLLAVHRLVKGIQADVEDLRGRLACYSVQKQGLLRSLYKLETALLLTVLLVEAPLRIEMFYKMTYETGPGKEPNLYKRRNGQWAIRFHYLEFKNWRSLEKKNYDVGLSNWAGTFVEHFLVNVRPFIDPPDTRDRLFIANAYQGKKKSKQTELRSNFLQIAYANVTEDYLRKQLHPHSQRHLVASFIILRNPGTGFALAADVLHDDPKTVRDFYAELQAEPGSDVYHGQTEDTFRDLAKKDANPDANSKCTMCGTDFTSAAKFCSECGASRIAKAA